MNKQHPGKPVSLRMSPGFSLVELLVTLSVFSIISMLSLALMRGAIEQLRFTNVSHAKMSLRGIAKEWLYDKAHNTEFVFEPLKGTDKYDYSYDEQADGGPLFTATPRDQLFPTLTVQIVPSLRGVRGLKKCVRGTDQGLWKACDEWDGYL